mmetsp:Transcript_20832/g.29952  ORF Transcript_20832/g.29952 Transcript_20832/m.29952 type:complete len:151 (-) Transcript_20832:130-582(-)|eukprot:CAMPEP_0185028626 /NCGR_PEP_ID=MMETSP1103-20130426/14465_1 /TAXON_ID=36769 /ORGANISM="Paraphysomonas bandaiensis, Strain Caron Lab Isolate" /LENGTH=150 /DNA_ID=CAMNT_0027563099 /DNA_START=87 /DNA_END=539 /DNA_ORIENTATION=+
MGSSPSLHANPDQCHSTQSTSPSVISGAPQGQFVVNPGPKNELHTGTAFVYLPNTLPGGSDLNARVEYYSISPSDKNSCANGDVFFAVPNSRREITRSTNSVMPSDSDGGRSRAGSEDVLRKSFTPLYVSAPSDILDGSTSISSPPKAHE